MSSSHASSSRDAPPGGGPNTEVGPFHMDDITLTKYESLTSVLSPQLHTISNAVRLQAKSDLNPCVCAALIRTATATGCAKAFVKKFLTHGIHREGSNIKASARLLDELTRELDELHSRYAILEQECAVWGSLKSDSQIWTQSIRHVASFSKDLRKTLSNHFATSLDITEEVANILKGLPLSKGIEFKAQGERDITNYDQENLISVSDKEYDVIKLRKQEISHRLAELSIANDLARVAVIEDTRGSGGSKTFRIPTKHSASLLSIHQDFEGTIGTTGRYKDIMTNEVNHAVGVDREEWRKGTSELKAMRRRYEETISWFSKNNREGSDADKKFVSGRMLKIMECLESVHTLEQHLTAKGTSWEEF